MGRRKFRVHREMRVSLGITYSLLDWASEIVFYFFSFMSFLLMLFLDEDGSWYRTGNFFFYCPYRTTTTEVSVQIVDQRFTLLNSHNSDCTLPAQQWKAATACSYWWTCWVFNRQIFNCSDKKTKHESKYWPWWWHSVFVGRVNRHLFVHKFTTEPLSGVNVSVLRSQLVCPLTQWMQL